MPYTNAKGDQAIDVFDTLERPWRTSNKGHSRMVSFNVGASQRHSWI